MDPHLADRQTSAPRLLALALVTVVALYLVWAAFHDITHGEADLTAEYAFLCACAAWFAYVGMSLFLARHRTVGIVSLAALAAGISGQREIGPGTTATLSPSYLATVGAMLWFLLLSGILAVMSWRASRHGQHDVEAQRASSSRP
jgi:hypothetical protein